MNKGTYCQWGERRGTKLYRCVNLAVGNALLGSESIAVCPLHLSTIQHMVANQRRYEELAQAAVKEQERVLAIIKDLEAAVANKRGNELKCPQCHTVFSHTGVYESQYCPKCRRRQSPWQ